MRQTLRIAALIALLITGAWAQDPPNTSPITTQLLTLPVNLGNISPATQANIFIVGNPGPQNICYWMVSNFTLGASSPQFAGCLGFAPNVLSGSNYVQIAPVYPPGVLSIDVLKTTSPIPPSGACNCAVATGVAAGLISDHSNSTLAYTVNPFAVSTLALTLDNEVMSAGVSHLILRQNGVLVADLSSIGAGLVTSVSNADGTLTVSPTAGAVLASLNLGKANTWTATQTVPTLNASNINVSGPIVGTGPGAVELSGTFGASSSALANPSGTQTAVGFASALGETGAVLFNPANAGWLVVPGYSTTASTPVNGHCVGWSIASSGALAGVLALSDYGCVTVPAGSIFAVTGSPATNITTTGTPGGIPWFSSNSQLNSTALLGQYQFLYGGGAGSAPASSTTFFTNANGSLTLNLGVITSDINPLLMQWTTNSSGTPFSGVKFAVTNVAQAAGTFNYQFCGGPSASTCLTIDTSGNLVTPGTGTFGFGSGVAGLVSLRAGSSASAAAIAGAWNETVPASITGTPIEIKPGAAASGIWRDTNAAGTMTDAIAELSQDATTNNSNAVTVVGINNTLLSGLATGVLKNTTGTGVPSIATSTDLNTPLYCADSSGSGTAQTCNTVPTFTPVANVSCIIYSTTTANTGTGLTINVNSFGAKSVAKWQTLTTLAANDIQANTRVRMCYDGTNWEADTIGNNPAGGGVSVTAFWSVAAGQNSAESGITQNATRIWAIYVPFSITTTAICYQVNTADNTANLYDIGMYASSGTKSLSIGATAGTTLFAATGQHCQAWASSATLSPGNYAIAVTSSAAAPAAKLGGLVGTTVATFFATVNATGGTTSGGALNASITFPATSWGGSEIPNFSLH